MEHSSSPSLSLNWVDLYKTARGALVIALGYAGTILLEAIIRDVSSGAIDLSSIPFLQPAVVTALTSALELLRRYLTEHRA